MNSSVKQIGKDAENAGDQARLWSVEKWREFSGSVTERSDSLHNTRFLWAFKGKLHLGGEDWTIEQNTNLKT